MRKFKLGDKVRCTDGNTTFRLLLRRAYRIIRFRRDGLVQVKGHDIDETVWWFPDRFEKVVSNKRMSYF